MRHAIFANIILTKGTPCSHPGCEEMLISKDIFVVERTRVAGFCSWECLSDYCRRYAETKRAVKEGSRDLLQHMGYARRR
jgi:hypothetical protein